jgi:hypothetical protein
MKIWTNQSGYYLRPVDFVCIDILDTQIAKQSMELMASISNSKSKDALITMSKYWI